MNTDSIFIKYHVHMLIIMCCSLLISTFLWFVGYKGFSSGMLVLVLFILYFRADYTINQLRRVIIDYKSKYRSKTDI